jgi:hypothetical protein
MATPTTIWITDNGTTIDDTTEYLEDQQGVTITDQSSVAIELNNSSAGLLATSSWNAETFQSTQWFTANNNDLATNTAVQRTQEDAVVRITESGVARVLEDSNNQLQTTTTWTRDEY